ncbi:MAG: response regulator [Deltaproteobacteria bacterium]|nr:response regulator [Deltaproteobacteria bacterium]
MKILAADDDEMSLEMLSSILASQGVVCTTVANGRLALEALEATPDFDVMLLDLQMPVQTVWFSIKKR